MLPVQINMRRVNDGCKKGCCEPTPETKNQSGGYDRDVVDPLIYLVPYDLVSRSEEVKNRNQYDHYGNNYPHIQAVSRGNYIERMLVHLEV